MSEAIQTHQPCDDCGSSDALTIYPTHTYCFSCETRTNTDASDDTPRTGSSSGGTSSLYRCTYTALAKRNITEETARFWSYGRTDLRGQSIHCANYLDENRQTVAQKLRFPDKTFPWTNRAAFKGLYGQWLWRDGGKQVVITEGEIDALSVSQVQQNKWPVVSLVDGGGKNAVKPIKEAYEWLQKFEKIILFFDNDEKGRQSVEIVKRMLPLGKVYIAFAPEGYKDANDLLMAGKGKQIIDAIWGAKQYRPEGLVSGSAVLDRLRKQENVVAFPYPDFMDALNYKTGGGIRLGELDTWTSGTGMGKTTIIKALQNHFFHTTDFNQALIHLEEPLEDTGNDLIAYEVGKRFQIDDPAYRETLEYNAAAEKLFLAKDEFGNDRLQLYDAFGSMEDDSLYEIIRYAAKAMNCKIIWLDHLSILVSDMGDGAGTDERKRIDSIMHNLKSLTIELGIYIGLISHLRKPPGNGKSFEQGAVPSLDDLRGSGGIKQLSNGVFAISRDQQATDPEVRNTSTVTVLKCRKTGRTGTADFLTFSDATGRIEKGKDPALADNKGAFNDESNGEY
ncbi:DnaB-like helicase C-terminal domain-containing protein [Pararhizobium sp. A13]|uniref:DnaB-like helicase C-terminal domain-containing protein n=1 Tax=Pararhizobium sp. A13 TaxID=3133975 RepID=UPI0032454E4A